MTLDVTAMISRLKILVFVIILFIAGSFFEGMLVSVFPQMKQDLNVTYGALGFLLTTLFVVGSLSQLAWGFSLDRRKIIFVLVGGLGALVLGIAILACLPIYGLSVLGVAMLGAGAKCLPLTGLIILVRCLPHKALGRWLFLPFVLGPTGIAIAPLGVMPLSYEIGWQFTAVVLVLVIAILCIALAWFCVPVVFCELLPTTTIGPTVEYPSNRLLVLICFGLILALTAFEIQLLKASHVFVVHHHSQGPDDLLRARSLANQHVTASILFHLLGLVVSVFLADFTRRPGLWIGVGLAISAFLSLIFVVFQQLPTGVTLVIMSTYWFTLAAVKIPVLKLFIQLLHPAYLGIGLGVLLTFVDFISSPRIFIGDWLAGHENFSFFAVMSFCIFGLAAGFLIYFSRTVRTSNEELISKP